MEILQIAPGLPALVTLLTLVALFVVLGTYLQGPKYPLPREYYLIEEDPELHRQHGWKDLAIAFVIAAALVAMLRMTGSLF